VRKGKCCLRKVLVALCTTERKGFVKKKLGVKHEAEVSDLWAPRDSGVLKLEWDRCNGTTSGK
jgi:hypothetical protein